MSTIDTTMAIPIFRGEGRIDWDERPVPAPGPGELLVRVAANAICGTDRLQLRWGSPVTPGHELSGTVVATGDDTSTAVGTAGVVYLMGYCGHCRFCGLGHTNQCLHKHGDVGFERDGGYAPYAVIDERTFFPIGDDVDLLEATLLLDVMGTSGHAIGRALMVHDDIQSVLIAGAGPIGLGLVAMARILLPEATVVVTDVTPYRLALAEELGARSVALGDRPLADLLREHELARPDVAFDAAGRETAHRTGLDVLRKRGVLVCVGHGQGLTLNVSPDLIARERSILGSEYFRYGELTQNLALLREHREHLVRIITHRFAASSLDEAFALFNGGEAGKVVIEP